MLGQRHQAETAVGPSGAAAEFRFLVPDPAGGAGDAAEGGIPDWPPPRPPPFVSLMPLLNPKIAEQVDVALRPLGGIFRCSASPNCRAEHQDVPLGNLECGW